MGLKREKLKILALVKTCKPCYITLKQPFEKKLRINGQNKWGISKKILCYWKKVFMNFYHDQDLLNTLLYNSLLKRTERNSIKNGHRKTGQGLFNVWHSMYIRTVSLLSILLFKFKLWVVLSIAVFTVHLISAPDQPGREQIYHFIKKKLRAYCPNIYTEFCELN